MNELQIFNNPQFGQIRTVEINGKIQFVAIDIAKALGYTNPNKAINDHCRWVTKRDIPHPQSASKTIEVNIIPEGDIYRLISNSELPAAEKFESWIFDEVLPSIRKTGGYIPTDDNESEEDIMAKALLIAQRTIEKKNQIITEMKPKAEFFDAVADSKTAIEMSQAAKVLNFGKGRNTLFAILRAEGILRDNNEPYQEYIDRGYFRIIEQKYQKPDGSTNINIKTLVYQRGLDYIRKILDKKKAS